MATAWLSSFGLNCKSSAVADDVYRFKRLPLLPVSCATDDSVEGSVASLPVRDKPRSSEHRDQPARSTPARSRSKKKTKPVQQHQQQSMASSPARPSSALLTMAALPEGHPSRRTVELIFSSGWWGSADAPAPEAKVEALFRVHSTARAVARFERARAAARARGAAFADARCAADGNEMMRFQCRAAGPGGEVVLAAVATCRAGAADEAVRTFAGSGAAHAGAGCGAGRRVMLVCRVIAGRVRRDAGEPGRHAGEYDSVDMGGGEIVVLDRRAVLPCLVVIYKVKAPDCSATSRPH